MSVAEAEPYLPHHDAYDDDRIRGVLGRVKTMAMVFTRPRMSRTQRSLYSVVTVPATITHPSRWGDVSR